MSSNLHVRIKQEEVVEDFKQYVLEKYGSLHSNMGPEVARGLIMVMESENYGKYGNLRTDELLGKISETHTHTKLTPAKEHFLREFERAFKYVKSIKPETLEGFIVETEGIADPRSINNRIKFLKSICWVSLDHGKFKISKRVQEGVDELLYGPISEDVSED